jgi:hypothetical protein
MVEAISDYLLEDHMVLMTENADLRHKLDRAIQMLDKLRNNYPKGGYSSSMQDEWDSLLEELNRR